LYLQGWIQADIAKEVGISPATVSRDIKALQAEWLQSALIDIDAAKAQELAKIDRVERECWDAWVRSCQDAETFKQKGAPDEQPGKVKTAYVERIVKGQAGDSHFLDGVLSCIDRRCKILGIDAATKTLGMNVDLSRLTEVQLQRLAAGDDLFSILTTPGTS